MEGSIRDRSATGILLEAVIFVVITAFCAGAARAATITQDGVFSTQNQSLWQPGPAGGNFHFDFLNDCPACFGYTSAKWGASGPTSISGPSLLPGAPGSWSITGSLNPGYVGLNPVLDRNAGSVAVDYPVRLTYNVPSGPIKPGSPVTIGTSYMPSGSPLLQTTGENVKASLNLVASISGNISDTYYPFDFLGLGNIFGCAAPCELFNEPFNININKEVLSFGAGSTSVTWSPPGVGSGISLNVPNQLNLTTNQFDGNANLSVSGAANPPILSGDLELLDGLIFLGVPPGVLNGSLPGAGSYSVLSARFQGGFVLYDQFSFGVDGLPITLTANTGEVHTGRIGQSFTFTADDNPLVIDAQVGIDDTFNAIEGAGLGLTFSWAVLKANLFGFQLGPLAGDSYTLANTSCMTLNACWTNTTFPLEGFNTLDNQFVFVVTPEPGTIWLALSGLAGLFGWRLMSYRTQHAGRPAVSGPALSGRHTDRPDTRLE